MPRSKTNCPTLLRTAAVLRQFQEVADKYSMLRPGKLARSYAGLCEVDLGNLPEADQQLTAAVAGGDSYVQPLARLALAGVQARENKAADAEQTFRYLGNGVGLGVCPR